MKIAVVSRSLSSGGAAVAARRLVDALRASGAEVSVVTASSFPRIFRLVPFVFERLQVFLHLLPGRRWKNLWKLDTARFGLPVWRLREVREADAVILHWTNQGFLSLGGLRRLRGKRILWTMHDMWPFTSICHHSMDCLQYEASCRSCPFLGGSASGRPTGMSLSVWRRKKEVYSGLDITFVAVSRWLASCASRSSLLDGARLEVIPNAFSPVQPRYGLLPPRGAGEPRRILFAAAVLDNWIKGLDVFREAVSLLAGRLAGMKVEVVLLGAVNDPASLEGFALPVRRLGSVSDEASVAGVFSACDVVVNSSLFENLPTTLVEGQAYGAVPVAFDRGGQSDIIDHRSTGWLAVWNDNPRIRAEALAEGILWALEASDEVRTSMRTAALSRFSPRSVALSYLSLLNPL